MTETAAASRAPESMRFPSAVDPAQVAALAEPIAAETGCALYDVQWRGGTLVVLATASEGDAVDVEALGKLSRRLSAALDTADMVSGRYVLEVSSPGLERSLRRPEHFAGAVGERAVIRTSGPLRRRIVGEVLEADGSAVCLRIEQISGASDAEQQIMPGVGQPLSVPFDDIAKARTTFEWGSPPRRTPRSRSEAEPEGEAVARAAREPVPHEHWEQERQATGKTTSGLAGPRKRQGRQRR